MSFAVTLSHLEISALMKKDPVGFLPIGSQEQHGFLPTGIDTLLADGYAQILSNHLKKKNLESIIFPTLPYGFTPICQGYPGSISISPKSFKLFVTEIIDEMIALGFKKIVIINAQRDNQTSLDEVVTSFVKRKSTTQILNPIYAWLRTEQEFKRKYPHRALPLTIKPMEKLVKKTGLLRHADSAELSFVYAIYPELQTSMEKNLPEGILPDLHSKLPSTHKAWKAVTKKTQGGAGDPRAINVPLAQKVLDAMSAQLYQDLTE